MLEGLHNRAGPKCGDRRPPCTTVSSGVVCSQQHTFKAVHMAACHAAVTDRAVTHALSLPSARCRPTGTHIRCGECRRLLGALPPHRPARRRRLRAIGGCACFRRNRPIAWQSQQGPASAPRGSPSIVLGPPLVARSPGAVDALAANSRLLPGRGPAAARFPPSFSHHRPLLAQPQTTMAAPLRALLCALVLAGALVAAQDDPKSTAAAAATGTAAANPNRRP